MSLYEDSKRGFTLIELLAVIVILAVIALIATPLVLNIIERAEKGAFKDSVYGIMEAAEFQVILDDSKYPITFVYPEDSERIKFKGTRPTEGYIQIVNEGKMKLALGNGRWCAVKDVNESQVTINNGHCETIELDRPIISGYGDLNQEIDLNASYTLPNVTATDKDGNKLNITTTIKQGDNIVDKIDTSKVGSYTITYTTEPDKEGNTSTVTVTIKIIKKETDVDKVIESGTNGGGLELIDDTYYYRGAEPNNWIQFNNELWRIISIETGVMKVAKFEKMIRPWDSSGGGKGSNDWHRPADINTYLNGEFYNTIDSVSKEQIEVGTFYTGTVNWNPNASVDIIKENEMVQTWKGKVGLMNVSDYVYASTDESCISRALDNRNCKNENWLYLGGDQWTINASSLASHYIMFIKNYGEVVGSDSASNFAYYNLWFQPVVFLKSSVKIISGNGSKTNPFIIK